jgi:hypothetical protein
MLIKSNVYNKILKFSFKSNDPWLFSLDWTRKEVKINKKMNSTENSFLEYVLNVPNDKNLFFKTLSEKEKTKVNTYFYFFLLNYIICENFKIAKWYRKNPGT